MKGAESVRLLICGAFAPELDLLREKLADRSEVALLELGVGSVAAALSLAGYLSTAESVEEVLLLGSAGAYPLSAPGARATGARERTDARFVFSTDFHKVDLAALTALATVPSAMRARVQTQAGPLGTRLSSLPAVVSAAINSTDSVSAVLPEDFVAPFAYETMEAFGAAEATRAREVNFAALLAVTNRVGVDGSTEWFKNHKEMGRSLQQLVLEHL